MNNKVFNFKTGISLLAVVLLISCKTTAPVSQSKVHAETDATVVDLDRILPPDDEMVTGVLPNGMTYYLQSTDVVKDRASYYIIQNVGSVLENDEQQGLAHFLEHMAFNGTETFPGKAFLDKMQENGLMFGRDVNAYTSFDETVYNVNNVPLNEEMTEAGLQILKDWSNHLLLTDEEIDAERGVIKEEWRQRRNARGRISEQIYDVLFGHSKYSKRSPIGLMEVVENFDYKVLRDFYHDWYRTDLQAIAIVGDFDVAEMETKVKEKFSSIPAVENAPERYKATIEDREEFDYVLAMDDEVLQPSSSFYIRRNKSDLVPGSVAELRQSLVDAVLTDVINTRFYELSVDPKANFQNIRFGNGGFIRGYETLSLSVVPKEGKQQASFELAMKELQRAIRFGFTAAEIKRAKDKLVSSYQSRVSAWQDRSHKEIVDYFKSSYLQGAYVGAIEPEAEAVEQLLAQMTNKDFIGRLESCYQTKNRVLVVTGVAGKNNLTESQAKAIIGRVENNQALESYSEENEERNLMDGVNLEAGSITTTEINDEMEFTKYVLSNGIEVYYKYSDKQKDQVMLDVSSDGGSSLVEDKDLYKTSAAMGLAAMSGLGEFSNVELQKLISGKRVRLRNTIGSISEGISGVTEVKDIETALQLINLRFTKPRFEDQAFELLKQRMKAQIKTSKKQLRTLMFDSITVSLYGREDPAHVILTEELVDALTLEDLKRIYLDRFNNAADFKFIFVGDLTKETLEPLMTQYLASISTTADREEWKDNYHPWLKPQIKKEVYLEMATPKNIVNIRFTNRMDVSTKDQYLARVLGSILQLRYTESLREDEGGTYGASARAGVSREPRPTGSLSVNFECNPDLRHKLVALVYEEIEKIKSGEVREDDFDKIIRSVLKDRVDAKNNMSYDFGVVKTFVDWGYNMDAPENFEDLVNSITKQDVQEMAKRITSGDSFEFVFVPAE